MLKEGLKKISAQPKSERKIVSVELTPEMYKEVCAAAVELECPKSEYFRRLHKFAQQD